MKKKNIEKHIKKQLKGLEPKINKVKGELKKFEEKSRLELKKWQPKIEKFKSEAIEVSTDAKTNLHKLLKEYKQKEKELVKKFSIYKKASAGALKDLKTGLTDVSKDLSDTFNRIAGHFKK